MPNLNIGIILAEKRNPVKTYWFIFTGLAQQNIRSLTLITRVRDLLSGSSGFYYRVNDQKTMDALKDRFPATKLFTVEDKFGSWEKVMKEHFAAGAEFDRLVAAGRQ